MSQGRPINPGTPGKPAAGPRCAYREPPAHLDAPLRTAFGLLILWASLGLIFWAHSLSDNYIRLEKSGVTGTPAGSLPLEALMQSCSANLPQYAPAEAVARMAETLKLEYDRNNIDKRLSKKARTYEISGLPLFKALHRLIDDRDVGYAIQGSQILFYPQKLQSPPMDHSQINWEAELDLSDQPLSIFPSADSDLWFTVQMVRDLGQSGNPWHTLQVELWKGAERQSTARAALDASGKAIISTATRENISFQIERTETAPGNRTPGRFRLIFSFQSFE